MLGGTKKESPRPTWGGDSGGGRSSGGGGISRVSKSCERATVRLRRNVQELRKILIVEPKNA